MNTTVELEIKRALEKAGCGIRRHPAPSLMVAKQEVIERDWLQVASRGGSRGPSLTLILRAVSATTGIAMADLKSIRRRRDIVRARMIYFALARRLTSQSFPAIGRPVGDKDHSTVMHGIAKVADHPQLFEPEFSKLVAAFQTSEE